MDTDVTGHEESGERRAIDDRVCRSCGAPAAGEWRTGDGSVRLCPPCATLHGLGCP